MKKGIFEKRIPTVFALFILLGGLAVTSVLIQRGVFTVSKASPDYEPKNIKVVNVTNTSFTVTFTTINPVIAAVSVSNATQTGGVYFDARENSANKPFVSHFITVKDLKPATTYNFTILSNGTTYLNSGKDFAATTVQTYTSLDTGNDIQGAIILPDGNPGSDSLVLLTPEGGATTGIITNDKGEYVISTDSIRTANYEDPFPLVSGTVMEIVASHGEFASTITSQYSPGLVLPPITLSNNYSFIASTEDETPLSTPSSLLDIPSVTKRDEIKITTPKQNQTFTDNKPQFRGQAFPGKLVKISVNAASPISVQVRSDPNGNWAYRPQAPLAPGIYTISIDTPNALGINQRATSTFQIFASGSQIAEAATPSATPTAVLPTATSTPTPTRTASLTPTPTNVIPSPTAPIVSSASPTFAPTPTTLPTSTVIPTQPPLPPTGTTTTTLILTTVSILFIVSGSVLLFVL